MFFKNNFTGAELPVKTLCLTYDDGPGENTLPIATFLKDEGIEATFFVVGKYAFHNIQILSELKKLNHLIGNHTYDHPELPFYKLIEGDVQNQIIKTDTIIKEHVEGDTIYFRAPYGAWAGDVADDLNSNILSTINHVGPIYWDVEGKDFNYWAKGLSVDEAVKKYLDNIIKAGRGIIVMHDDTADRDDIKQKNKTFELTKKLIPILKEQGFNFIRLDRIESIKRHSYNELPCHLQGMNKKYLRYNETTGLITVTGKLKEPESTLKIIKLKNEKVAIKTVGNLFFNCLPGSQEILSNTTELNTYSSFDLITVKSNKIILRAVTGLYLRTDGKTGKLLADGHNLTDAGIFTFSIQSNDENDKIRFKERFEIILKKLRKVKLKIAQKYYFG